MVEKKIRHYDDSSFFLKIVLITYSMLLQTITPGVMLVPKQGLKFYQFIHSDDF
jgi:hypothetical protein